MLRAVWAMPNRPKYSTISVRYIVLIHAAILIKTSTPGSHTQKAFKFTQLEHKSLQKQITGLCSVYSFEQPLDLRYNNPLRVYLEATIHFLNHQLDGFLQLLNSFCFSPIAVCWKLHPPTCSVDRIVFWLLSFFGLSNQGEEKSSCYIHAAVPTALCPYVSPSVCLSVCMPKLWSSLSDLMKEKKKQSSLWIPQRC